MISSDPSSTENLHLVPAQRPSERVAFYTTAPAASTLPEDQTLLGLLRILRRRWKTALVVALGLMALGTAICFLITPQYAATVTIEINKDDDNSDTAAHQARAEQNADEIKTEVQTDITVLQSDGLALETIRDCHLMEKAPFRNISGNPGGAEALAQFPELRQKAIALFQKKLKVDTPTDTRLITITFKNPDPATAASVANALSNKFIESTMERRHNSTSKASFWLQKQLDTLKTQVEQSEQKLADYEQKTGLAGVQVAGSSSGDGSANVSVSPQNTVTDRLFALNQELTTAEANLISAEAVYHLVASQDPEVVLGLGSSGSGSPSAALTQDQGIQFLRNLRAAEATLKQDYAAAAVKYGPNNPRLVELQQQLDENRKQIKAELQRISKRAKNAYEYAKRNRDSIKKQFVQQQSAANVLADQNVQLQILAQEAYSNRALYENLFSKLKTASLASGVRATRIDVVDAALIPGIPAIPKYPLYLAVIAVVGIIFGVSAAFLREGLDDTVRTARDFHEVANLPVLAYIPHLSRGRRRIADAQRKLLDSPKSPFAEAFRSLRTAIMAKSSGINKVFLVTSPGVGDGKTTVAFNLGVVFAQQGAQVLLMDGDLRHPTLHDLFGCDNSAGLADNQAAQLGTDIAGIVRHATIPNLSMLPAGPSLDFPAEFLASRHFGNILATCASRYDYIFIDSPPVLSVTDATIIATKVSGTIALFRSGTATRPLVNAFFGALTRAATPIIAALLNGVRDPERDGFYDFAYAAKEKEHSGGFD
jgi:capsular exopolysaccharide synthesis family protein